MAEYFDLAGDYVGVGFNPNATGMYVPLGASAVEMANRMIDNSPAEDLAKIQRARTVFGRLCRNRLQDISEGVCDIDRLLEIGAPDTDHAIAGKKLAAEDFLAGYPELAASKARELTEGVFMVPWGTIGEGEEKIEIYYKYTDIGHFNDEAVKLRDELKGSPFMYESTAVQYREKVPVVRTIIHTIFAVKAGVPSRFLRPKESEQLIDPINPAIYSAIGHLRGEFNLVVESDGKDDDTWPEDDLDIYR